MHFYALLHLYVLHRLFFCFFVCLFSFVFNYQFSFTLLSLSRHILRTRWNGPSVFFLSVLFFSIHRHHNILSSPKSSNRTNVKSGVSALSSTSTAFGTAASNARLEQTGNGHIDEALRQQALAEEEAAMNQYKVIAREVLLVVNRCEKRIFYLSFRYFQIFQIFLPFISISFSISSVISLRVNAVLIHRCMCCRQKYNRRQVARIPSSVRRLITLTSRSWTCSVQHQPTARYAYVFYLTKRDAIPD